MKTKLFTQIFLYTLLLIPALVFVWKYVAGYMDGDTIFVETREEITTDDIPSTTICTGFTYPEYLNLTHRTENQSDAEYLSKSAEMVIEVAENGHTAKQNLTLQNDSMQFSDLVITMKQVHVEGDTTRSKIYLKKCFSITVKSRNGESKRYINTKDFRLSLDMMISKPYPSLRFFGLTSKENSYGFIVEKWFDGKVQIVDQQSDIFDVLIVNVIEYQYLKSACSQDSYYQILADRFESLDTNAFLEQHFKFMCKTKNQYGGNYINTTCSPVSLPFRNNKTPICSQDIEKWCYQRVLERLMLDQTELSTRTCKVKEFKIKPKPISKNTVDGNLVVWIKFERAEEEIANAREWLTTRTFKTVKREQYVISTFSLIGNIGGTLGMFVGFSFLSTSEWIMNVIETLLGHFRSRKRTLSQTLSYKQNTVTE